MTVVQFTQRPELEPSDDGLLWADLWINIAFVLFALVSDPTTSWLLPDTRLLTQGTQEAPGTVLTLHLVADAEGTPVLREGTADGSLLDTDALAARLGDALKADPSTSIVLSVGATVPGMAILRTTSHLEQAGATYITLAQSITEGE